MNKFLKKCFIGLILIACLPLLPALLAGLFAVSPLLVLAAFIFGFGSIKSINRLFWRGGKKIASGTGGALAGASVGAVRGASWLFGNGTRRNRFMGLAERGWLLRPGHNGFLVDGHHYRLSEKSSYESLMIQGGMGRGKSTTFVMPNLLKLPPDHPSFVITDTSGEIYQYTAGYLERQGYQIKCLNLMDLTRSEGYNPLQDATSPQAIAELVHSLVRSVNAQSGQKASDPFWEQSAEKLIRIMAQCLHNQPDPALRNLANLRHLITSFDAHIAPKGQLGKIDQFVLSATQNGPGTFASYQAFVQGNLKTIQSVLMSADVALDPIGIPEVAALTATNTIQFSDLRQQKTALYILVNQTQMPFFSFLLNLFYADLFKSLLTNPQNPGRPVWLFLDEFGHLQINNFEIFASTSRKYNVGFAIFLQSLAQLEAQYGAVNARTIAEALGTEIYLPGMALDTARNLEARLGRLQKGPLMAANDIIRMKTHRALMLHSNRLPVMLRTKRYYEISSQKRRARMTPPAFPNRLIQVPKLITF